MTFVEYRPGPVLERRLAASANEAVRQICRRSRLARRQTRADIPLCDLILGCRLRINDFQVVLEEVLYHQPNRHIARTFTLDVGELTSKRMREMRLEGDKNALALASSVRLRNGEEAHFPLMDFRCKRTRQNLNKILSLFSAHGSQLPPVGCILSSQRSYHFYGLSVLSKAAWVEFLGRCLLLGPLADARYIAHCLLHGKSSLRITESPLHRDVPIISALVRRTEP